MLRHPDLFDAPSRRRAAPRAGRSGATRPARRSRSRARGQVIPIVALMLMLLAGFAALTIDAGVSYDQSRNDQDVADAAALAASSWIYSHPSSASVSGAYTEAANVATADCNGPAGTCPVQLTFYGSGGYSPAYALCTATSALDCGSVAAGNVYYTGISLTTTALDHFGNLGGGPRSHAIVNQAVAEVYSSGGAGGPTSTDPEAACEVCVFGDVTSTGKYNEVAAGGGSIDIGGYVYFNTSDDSIVTSNGYGIDVDGTQQINGYTVYTDGKGNLIEASGALGISGSAFSYSTSDVLKTDTGSRSELNVSGPTLKWGTQPSQVGNASTAPFSDPLASQPDPTYSGATTSCGSLTIYGGTTPSGCLSESGGQYILASGVYGSVTVGTPTTLNPGVYGSLTIQSTATFNPGTYVFEGSGITTTTGAELAGSGVTLYFTCGSGASPAGCGTWTPSTATCSGEQSGAGITFDGSTTLDLSASTSNNDDILFFYDPCNDNGQAFYVNSGGVTAGSGLPSGMLYGYSATLYTDSGISALPSPVLIGNIYFNSSSSTVGTSTGSINLGATSPPQPGNLVH